MHDNITEATCLFGAQPPTYLEKKNLSDGMKWNGQGMTADFNEIHYVGVKECKRSSKQYNAGPPAKIKSQQQY